MYKLRQNVIKPKTPATAQSELSFSRNYVVFIYVIFCL